MSVPPLTESTVIDKGGWHPRYVEVLAIATYGRFGFALVDGNGDRADVELEWWLFDGSEWEPDSSQGGGHYNFNHPWHWVGGMVSTDDGVATCLVCIYGAAPGTSSAVVSIDDATYRVPVGANGVWAFIAPVPDPEESTISVSPSDRPSLR